MNVASTTTVSHLMPWPASVRPGLTSGTVRSGYSVTFQDMCPQFLGSTRPGIYSLPCGAGNNHACAAMFLHRLQFPHTASQNYMRSLKLINLEYLRDIKEQ